MKIRNLLTRGAVIATVVAGGLGLTSGAAHASTICVHYLSRAMYYRSLGEDDLNNYQLYTSIGEISTALGYWDLYQMDISAFQYYSDRWNACNAQEP